MAWKYADACMFEELKLWDECWVSVHSLLIVTSCAIDKKLEIDKKNLENKLEMDKNLEIKLKIYKNLENKLEIYS